MTDYEKAVILNGIAVLTAFVGVTITFIAGIFFLPWWPAKVACALVVFWGLVRTLSAYYASR